MLNNADRADNYRRDNQGGDIRPGKQARRLAHKENALKGDAPTHRSVRRAEEAARDAQRAARRAERENPVRPVAIAPVQEAAPVATCPTCDVPLGERCVVKSTGKPSSKQHKGNLLAA